MLGAVAEWLPASVAGVELDPTAVGGEKILFWPRIPKSADIVQYASATQGTKRGDASIAWKFLNLPSVRSSATVKVHIRVLVPPSSTSRLMLPRASNSTVSIKYAETLPDLESSKAKVQAQCIESRRRGKGFNYNWEHNDEKNEWYKVDRKKAIGAPCQSFLFELGETSWSPPESVLLERSKDTELSLKPGLYDFLIDNWQLFKDGSEADEVPYCSDPESFSWDIRDATHII